MCRNIKTLFNFDPPVTDEESRAASLQFVRKITGFNKPSKANEAMFLAAVDEIAAISSRLLRRSKPMLPQEIARKKLQKQRPAQPNGSGIDVGWIKPDNPSAALRLELIG